MDATEMAELYAPKMLRMHCKFVKDMSEMSYKQAEAIFPEMSKEQLLIILEEMQALQKLTSKEIMLVRCLLGKKTLEHAEPEEDFHQVLLQRVEEGKTLRQMGLIE